MATETTIAWCHSTFNPWRGCSKVSPGCANCYAATLSKRNPGTLGVWGDAGTRVVASEAQWKLPLKWDRDAARDGVRPRIFVASMADVFEDWTGRMRFASGLPLQRSIVPGVFWTENHDKYGPDDGKGLTMHDVRRRLFSLIDQTPNIDWLLLTKRPENIARMLPDYTQHTPGMRATFRGFSVARPNVWLGVSVENQRAADERIPHLLRAPAAVRFLSVEPLLGPVDLSAFFGGEYATVDGSEKSYNFGLDWVIVGGESGPGARPCHVEWIRSIVRQCREAGVPCFVKQLGSRPRLMFDGPEWKLIDWPRGTIYDTGQDGLTLRLADPKGGDPAEWPEDLRVREMPKGVMQ